MSTVVSISDRMSAESQAEGDRRLAVVDIGSNSIRLVVYDQAGRTFVPLFNEKMMCGLGRDVAGTSRLNEDAMEMALETLERFRTLVEMMGVEEVKAFATAATRDADNGNDFVLEIERRTGFSVEVISGIQEAAYAGAGVLSSIRNARGIAGDLGGGSLELIGLSDGQARELESLKLGTLRLMDESGGNIKKAIEILDAEFDKLEWLSSYKGETFYVVGGAWRSLAKLHMRSINYPLEILHQYEIEASAAEELSAVIGNQSIASMKGAVGISRRRIETLPMAALILSRLLARIKVEKVCICSYGVREGLLFEQLDDRLKRVDPLIDACQRQAKMRSRFRYVGEALFRWTTPLFTDETQQERRIRHVTCIVGDMVWRTNPDHRTDRSVVEALYDQYIAIDHTERALMALSLAYRYKNDPKDEGTRLAKSLLSKSQRQFARKLGTSLRLGITLTGAHPEILDNCPLNLDVPGELQLHLEGKYASLKGDVIRKRFERLASVIDRQAEFVGS